MKIFKITGILIIILAFISIFVALSVSAGLNSLERVLALFSVALSIVLGAAVYNVGELLSRVAYLEQKLNLETSSKPAPFRLDKKARKTQSNFEYPQKQCPECGDTHDFDYPVCPRCKHNY